MFFLFWFSLFPFCCPLLADIREDTCSDCELFGCCCALGRVSSFILGRWRGLCHSPAGKLLVSSLKPLFVAGNVLVVFLPLRDGTLLCLL